MRSAGIRQETTWGDRRIRKSSRLLERAFGTEQIGLRFSNQQKTQQKEEDAKSGRARERDKREQNENDGLEKMNSQNAIIEAPAAAAAAEAAAGDGVAGRLGLTCGAFVWKGLRQGRSG